MLTYNILVLLDCKAPSLNSWVYDIVCLFRGFLSINIPYLCPMESVVGVQGSDTAGVRVASCDQHCQFDFERFVGVLQCLPRSCSNHKQASVC